MTGKIVVYLNEYLSTTAITKLHEKLQEILKNKVMWICFDLDKLGV